MNALEEDSLQNSDVVIDFSHAEATERNCAAAARAGKPPVNGTTGQSREQSKFIGHAAGKIPVVLASYFSVGVNALFWLTRKARELFGENFDLESVVAHDRLKKDAPSATWKR